ncbi:hypothetical protein CYY_005927 [Polysphondylium violaceum]|uniref:POU-specific domain-containing protein n=1 Tax=Polysphondylium violaceum TaxID=133409 RepID=A0A8J4Q1T1_9MYCE|nr:hypothetical protein CYY_005927 [Polysphondylium violaceum]
MSDEINKSVGEKDTNNKDDDDEDKSTTSTVIDKPVLKFNKKPSNKRYRKKTDDDESLTAESDSAIAIKTGDGKEETIDLQTLIEITKEKQKMRGKDKGISVGVLAESSPHVKQSFREIESKLDDSFIVHQEKQEVNVHLEKYLSEKMKKPTLAEMGKIGLQSISSISNDQKKDDDNDINNNKNQDNNDAVEGQVDGGHYSEKEKLKNSLYDIPDHLKPTNNTVSPDEQKTNWVTGIAEVPLPNKFKVKNIIETEKARQVLENNNLPKDFGKKNDHNFNQNYNRFLQNKKHKNPEKATDEETMENFKKRFRH